MKIILNRCYMLNCVSSKFTCWGLNTPYPESYEPYDLMNLNGVMRLKCSH